MSQSSNENSPAEQHDPDAERKEIAELDEELDARSEGEGLAAEAGRSEENGLSEG